MREPTSLPSDRPSRDLHAGEEGMLTLASLFVIVGFLVLIGLMANVGMTTSRKLETQNAADAVAYSAGVEMARGMNAITATNHLIGELTALAVLIHTFGGDELYEHKSPPGTPGVLQTMLEVFHAAAQGISQDAFPPVLDEAYDAVKPDPQVGGAIYDARIRLKLVLSWAFEVHFIGGLIAQLQFLPIVGPIFEGIGDAICADAWVFESKVLEESKILDGLEKMAQVPLNYIETTLRNVIIPGLYIYQDGFVSLPVVSAPWKAKDAANAVQAPNLADEVSLYPPWPILQLPVTKNGDFDKNNPERSQLMRASTPWIQWWRQEWIDFGKDALVLSRFAAAFEKRSTQYTLSIVKSLLNDKSIYLYVMSNPDPNGRGKTFEPWTFAAQSGQADRMFTVVGFAHRRAPTIVSSGIFRQENPDGMVCYAQAMFYNANRQVRGSGDKDWQPTAGWDTLNWNGPVPEYPGPVPQGDETPTPTTPEPLIRLDWQCKLVPTTRLAEASVFQTGSIGKILWRTLPATTPWGTLDRTH